MTQSKNTHGQQDKIQEIMGLVETYGEACENYGKHRRVDAYQAVENYRHLIESKLRELVLEPLTGQQRMNILNSVPYDDDDAEWMLTDFQLQIIIDGVERAHGITKEGGE